MGFKVSTLSTCTNINKAKQGLPQDYKLLLPKYHGKIFCDL